MSKGNDEKVFGMLGPAEKSGWSRLPFSTSNVLIHILESCHKYRPDNKITWWLQSIEPYEYHQEMEQLDSQQESTSDTTGTRNAEGFVTPDKSFSTMSTVSGFSGRRRGVEEPCYREIDLAENRIFLRSSCDPFPEDIATLVGAISQDHHSPGPSPDEVMHNPGLEALEMGTGEPEVEDYFRANVFTKPSPTDVIKRIEKAPMVKRVVPDLGSEFKLSTPFPDVLYRFNRVRAFTQRQQTLLRRMDNEMVANSQGLLYPFFSIEYKSDGPGGAGSLWSATNQ